MDAEEVEELSEVKDRLLREIGSVIEGIVRDADRDCDAETLVVRLEDASGDIECDHDFNVFVGL